ncbi:MAG: amino acid adenylation domain-containing protein, partial [Vicinamibacteria bacterium]
IFDAGARRSPDRVAVEHGGSSLTYRELDSRASRLARRLVSLGAGPEVAVAVSLERSIEMAVAVLAILKTGAAYVPLDPAYPEERLRFMIEDSEAPIVVTSKRARMSLPAGVEVVFADGDFPSDGDTVDLPSNRGGSESPAYVIFTSGSTGRPKGVAMRERALVNLLRWQLPRFEGVPRRTLQFAPLSFDVSFQEIFSTWGSSGTLVLVSDEVRRDPVELLSYLGRHSVERLFLPFVALQQLVETAASRKVNLPALREVITAGEQLRITPSLRAFFASHPSSRLENQYGPTESHVVTAFPLEGPVSDWAPMSPIGRPIANDETYVLDSELEPVPRGVAGEIYLGGDGLARGYHGRPEPTAERFVPDPFSGRPGARLYRTGDLGRILRDGNLQYLGRADSQVKLRGFRVEPGEIEHVLSEHPKVRDTAVVVREDARANPRLVAYVVPSSPADAPSGAELRESLKRRLPEYMVPSLFVVLEELPLTPSGKLDRRSLPEPASDPLEGEDLEASPRSPLEDGILEIWKDVLGVPSAGIHEDFFDCGGHSLLATQVVSRIRETFGVEIPLRALFEGPTIAGLALAVEKKKARGEDAESLPIAPAPRESEAPLSFAQQRLWFVEQVQKGASGYRISAATRLRGPLDVVALERAIEEILRRHHSLRTTFVKKGTEAVAVVAPLGSFVLSIDDVRDEGAALALAAEERGRPFDLEKGPLFRCRLL